MTLRLNGDNSGFTEIKAADTAGDNSIKLPASNGSAYQLLRNGSSAGELAYESDLRVDGTGNVGVGVDPAYSGVFGGSQRVLHVGGTAAPGVRITSSTSDQGDFIIQAGNSGRATYVASLAENGDIAFFSRPTGGSVTERFRIKGAGQIALSANCPGIDFSGIQTNAAGMTSETLDSYEEGSWSPTIKSWNGSYTTQNGTYVKIGKMVFCQGEVITDGPTGSSMDSYPGIDSLPFVPGLDITGGSGNVSQRHMGTATILGQNASMPTGEMAFVTFDNGGGAALFPNNISNTQAKNFSVSYISTTSDFGYRFNLAYYTNA